MKIRQLFSSVLLYLVLGLFMSHRTAAKGATIKYAAPGIEGLRYSVTDDGELSCIGEDGKLRWVRRLPIAETPPFLAVNPDGITLVASGKGALFILDGKSGTTVWEERDPGLSYHSAGFLENDLVIEDGKSVRRITLGGQTVWQIPLLGNEVTHLLATPRKVYVGDIANRMFCIDSVMGTVEWIASLDSWVRGKPSILGNGDLAFVTQRGKVYRLDSEGSIVFRADAGARVFTELLVSDAFLLVHSDDGTVSGWSLDEKRHYTAKVGAHTRNAPVAVCDFIVYSEAVDRLSLLSEDGRFIASKRFDGVIMDFGAAGKRALWIGYSDGRLETLTCESLSEGKNEIK